MYPWYKRLLGSKKANSKPVETASFRVHVIVGKRWVDLSSLKMIGIPERHMNPVPQSTKNVKNQIIKTNKPKTNFESNNISNNDFKKSPVTVLGEEEGINRWSALDC